MAAEPVGTVFNFPITAGISSGTTLSVTMKHDNDPAIGTTTYDGYTRAVVCSDKTSASPFDWTASYAAGKTWTLISTHNKMVDAFWALSPGSDPNAAVISLVNSNNTTELSNLHTALHNARIADTASSKPKSSAFVVTPSLSTYYDSETGVNRTGTWTVNTGTSDINARVTYPAGVTLHFINSSGDEETKTDGTNWLGYTGSAREFWFTAPADAAITGNINIKSVANSDHTSTGYYIDNVYLLSANSQWAKQTGETVAIQTMCFPSKNSVSKTYNLTFDSQMGNLKLKKTSANTTITNSNNKYTLGGAIYVVKDEHGNEIGEFETDVNGVGHVISNHAGNMLSGYWYNRMLSGGYISTDAGNTEMELPVGKYTIVEVSAPKTTAENGNDYECYAIDTTAHSATITNGGTITITSNETPKVGSVSITKKSACPNVTDNNSMYNLTGATYTIYKVSSSTATSGTKVGVIQIKNNSGTGKVLENIYNSSDVTNGASKMSDLPFGYYIAKETATSNDGSYLKSDKIYRVTIDSSNYSTTQKFEDSKGLGYVTDEVKNDPVSIGIHKQDAEGNIVQGAGNLEGAVFRICYYDGMYTNDTIPSVNSATRTWYIETKKNELNQYLCGLEAKYLSSKYTSDALYTDLGNVVVPLGTITIEEYKAPVGYTKDDATIAFAKDTETQATFDGRLVMQIVDSDIGLVKVDASNKVEVGSEMWINEQVIRGDIEFTKLDYITGEPMGNIPFRITSETTKESHIIYTDENGVASTASSKVLHSINTNGNDALTDYDLGSVTGIWFGEGEVIDELPCTANKVMRLLYFKDA